MDCRNPYCDIDSNKLHQGWCRRCQGRALRNGVLHTDRNVPNSAKYPLVSIYDIQQAAKDGVTLEEFSFTRAIPVEAITAALEQHKDSLKSMGIRWEY